MEKLISKIDLIFIYVKDLNRAIDFYKNNLGMELVYESKVWAEFFGKNNTKFALWKKEDHSPYDTHIFLAVDSIKEAKNYLEKNNVKITFGPEHYFYGDVIEFLDSEGNKLGLYKRDERKISN